MAKFVFNDPTIHLDIAGHQFDMPVPPGIKDVLMGYNKRLLELAAAEMDAEQREEAAMVILRESIDRLLGQGAFETIFKFREPNANDINAILEYITAELREQRGKKNQSPKSAGKAGKGKVPQVRAPRARGGR